MPADLPTTPEQWAAIVPNETDEAINGSAEDCALIYFDHPEWRDQRTQRERIAAASRIAEHERCVERLAEWLAERDENYELAPTAVSGMLRAMARDALEEKP